MGALVVHIFPLFHIWRLFNLSVTFVLFQPGSQSCHCVPETVIHLQPWPQGQLIYPRNLHHLSYFPASPWATTHRVHSFWRNAQNPPSEDTRDWPLLCFVDRLVPTGEWQVCIRGWGLPQSLMIGCWMELRWMEHMPKEQDSNPSEGEEKQWVWIMYLLFNVNTV